MSLILKSTLFLSIAVNCMGSGQSFFDHLVSDNRQQSYYLVIHVDSPNYKGKAIIKNVSLFLFVMDPKIWTVKSWFRV